MHGCDAWIKVLHISLAAQNAYRSAACFVFQALPFLSRFSSTRFGFDMYHHPCNCFGYKCQIFLAVRWALVEHSSESMHFMQ